MTEVTPARTLLQVEELRFRAAVSEATAQRIGAGVNFIQTNVYEQKDWWINGAYGAGGITIPFTAIDGLTLVEFNAEIIDAFMFVRQAGSSGNTTLDIEYATTPGGSWTSIFSTKPSINYQAGDFSWCYVGSAFANTTAPVLSTTSINAKTVFRCNISSAQGGDPRGCGLVLIYRPR